MFARLHPLKCIAYHKYELSIIYYIATTTNIFNNLRIWIGHNYSGEKTTRVAGLDYINKYVPFVFAMVQGFNMDTPLLQDPMLLGAPNLTADGSTLLP